MKDTNIAGRGSAEEQEKAMRTLGYVVAVTTAAALGALAVKSLPDVRRYLAIRKM